MIILRLISTPGFHESEGAVWFKKVFELEGNNVIEITRDRSAAVQFESEDQARGVLGNRYEEFVIESVSS